MDTTSVRETRQAEYVLALVQARVVRVQVVLCRTYWTNRPRFHMRLFVHGDSTFWKNFHTLPPLRLIAEEILVRIWAGAVEGASAVDCSRLHVSPLSSDHA